MEFFEVPSRDASALLCQRARVTLLGDGARACSASVLRGPLADLGQRASRRPQVLEDRRVPLAPSPARRHAPRARRACAFQRLDGERVLVPAARSSPPRAPPRVRSPTLGGVLRPQSLRGPSSCAEAPSFASMRRHLPSMACRMLCIVGSEESRSPTASAWRAADHRSWRTVACASRSSSPAQSSLPRRMARGSRALSAVVAASCAVVRSPTSAACADHQVSSRTFFSLLSAPSASAVALLLERACVLRFQRLDGKRVLGLQRGHRRLVRRAFARRPRQRAPTIQVFEDLRVRLALFTSAASRFLDGARADRPRAGLRPPTSAACADHRSPRTFARAPRAPSPAWRHAPRGCARIELSASRPRSCTPLSGERRRCKCTPLFSVSTVRACTPPSASRWRTCGRRSASRGRSHAQPCWPPSAVPRASAAQRREGFFGERAGVAG